MLNGILRSCEKRPISLEQIEKIVDDMKKRVIVVEKGIITRDENEGGYGYVQSN